MLGSLLTGISVIKYCPNNSFLTAVKLLPFIFLFVIEQASVSAQPPEMETLLRGEKAFDRCAGCHTVEKGGPHLLGPNLHGIFGRDIASAEGYAYSNQLLAMDGVWDQTRLNRYIARPKLAVPGNKMPFPGITSPHRRTDLIAWLKSNPTNIRVARLQGDAATGARLAAACLACHSIGKDEENGIGPNLWGVVGRPVAGVNTYDYSERLMRRGGIWTPTNLDAFFIEKKEFDQGSHMAFQRLLREVDRHSLISWLSTLNDDNAAFGQ